MLLNGINKERLNLMGNDTRSNKSSIDYTELAGLRVALTNAKLQQDNPTVIEWINNRIAQLIKK